MKRVPSPLLLPLVALLTGCPADQSPSSAPAEGSGSESSQEPEQAPEQAEAQESGQSATGADSEPEAEPEQVEEDAPPELLVLMRAVGYADAQPTDLADFVPVPPGATGEAGSFGNGEREANVALLRYPNPRYARPHVTDVRERRLVLPETGEAVIANGRFVIHVMATTRDNADMIAGELAEELGWTNQAADE